MDTQNKAVIFMVFLSFGQLAQSLSTTQETSTLTPAASTQPTTHTNTSSIATTSTTASTTDKSTTITAATTKITVTATATSATANADTTYTDTTHTDAKTTTSADYANNGDDFNVPRLDQDSTDMAAIVDNTTETTLALGGQNTTLQATETSTATTQVSIITTSITTQMLTTTSTPQTQATSTVTSPSTSSLRTLSITSTKQPTTTPPTTTTTTVTYSTGTTKSATKPTAVPTTTMLPLTTTRSKVTTTDVKSTTTSDQSDKANRNDNNTDCEKRMFSKSGLVAFIIAVCLCLLLMIILLGLIMFYTRRRNRNQLHDDDSTPRLKMLEIRERGGAGSSSIKPGSSTDDGLQTYSLDYEGQEKDYEKHVRDKIEEHKRKTKKQSEEPGSTFMLGKKATTMSTSTAKDRSNPSSPTSSRENTTLRSDDGDNDSQVFNFSRKPGESLVARRASNFENNDRRRSAASTGKGGKVMLSKGDDFNVDKFDDV